MSAQAFSERPRYSSDEDDSSSSWSSSSYSSLSFLGSSSSPKSMSPREYLPFFTVRQRRRPLPSVALNSGGDHDDFSRETLRHDKAQRGIHWPTMHWSSWCLSVALTIWLLVQFRKKNYIFGYRDTSLAGDLQSLYASRRMRPSKNFWRSDTVIDNHNNNDDHHDNFVHQTRHKKKRCGSDTRWLPFTLSMAKNKFSRLQSRT